MPYKIQYNESPESLYSDVEEEYESGIRNKLNKIAESQWRSPDYWFDRFPHPAGWKCDIGSYRVFAGIDPDAERIRVEDIKYRKNLYRG